MNNKYMIAILAISFSMHTSIYAQVNRVLNTNNSSTQSRGISQSEVERILIKRGYADRSNSKSRAKAIIEQLGFDDFFSYHTSEKSGPNWLPEHVIRFFAEEKLNYVRNSYFEKSAKLQTHEVSEVKRLIEVYANAKGISANTLFSHPNFDFHLEDATVKYLTEEKVKSDYGEMIAKYVFDSLSVDLDRELKDHYFRLSRLESKSEFEKLSSNQQDSVYKELYKIRQDYLNQGQRELGNLFSAALELSKIDEASAKEVFGFVVSESMSGDSFVKELRKSRQEVKFYSFYELKFAMALDAAEFTLINAQADAGKIDRHNAFLYLLTKLYFVNNFLKTKVEIIHGSEKLIAKAKAKMKDINSKQKHHSGEVKKAEKISQHITMPMCLALFKN